LALPSIIEAVKHLALVAVVKDQDDFADLRGGARASMAFFSSGPTPRERD